MTHTTSYYSSEGSVRGTCGHKHRTLNAALACIRRDELGCCAQGGYSDRVPVAHGSAAPVEQVWDEDGEEWYWAEARETAAADPWDGFRF